METVIQTSNLTKSYGATVAVDNVNMTVNKGDIYGFIGSNGAGKTTMIRMLMGLAKPTSGSMSLFGKSDKSELTKLRASIGSIVETPSLMLNMTAYDNLKTQMLMYGQNDPARIDELLQLVGLSDTGRKKVKNFSLGMKQRLSIAQALLNRPKLLILDEPTNGMDPQGIIEIRKLLQRLRYEQDITILISSHILTELQQLATRFGIINNGKLIEEFTADELSDKIVLSVTIEVSDLEKSRQLILTKFTSNDFWLPKEHTVVIGDSRNFSQINKLLVSNGIDVSVVSKDQFNLEKYFITKVGGAE